MIGDNDSRVQAGSVLVETAGRSMTAIVSQVNQVAALIERISHATSEQAGSVAEVNTAVRHLDQMTQRNAVLVEQASLASDELEKQAVSLSEAVEVFSSRSEPAPARRQDAPPQQRQRRLAGV